MRENKEPVNIDHLFIAIFCSLSIWCSFAMYTKQSIIFFIPPLILQIVSTVVFSAIERRCRFWLCFGKWFMESHEKVM